MDIISINISNVSLKYYEDSWPIVQKQIMKSSIQMSNLLNDIFGARAESACFLNNLNPPVLVSYIIKFLPRPIRVVLNSGILSVRPSVRLLVE